MGNIYLDWLDDVVAQAAKDTGYQWALLDGDWLHRARSSGGYDAAPLCVMWHHTAGSDDAWGDARYQCYSADARPISNVTVDSKIALVLAGGATNTNGSGRSMNLSRGTAATDDMNRRAVGVEICNNGVGAPYSERQINFLIRMSNLINQRCGNKPTDVCTHQHYSPDRKVDPATTSAVQGPWRPGSCTSSGSWNRADLANECQRRWTTTPTPTPPAPTTNYALLGAHDEGDPMFIASKDGKLWIGTGVARRMLADNDEADLVIEKLANAGNPLRNYAGGGQVTARGQVNGVGQMNRLGVDVNK